MSSDCPVHPDGTPCRCSSPCGPWCVACHGPDRVAATGPDGVLRYDPIEVIAGAAVDAILDDLRYDHDLEKELDRLEDHLGGPGTLRERWTAVVMGAIHRDRMGR